MARVLLLYSSVYGLSRRICDTLQAHLAAAGVPATVAAVAEPPADPAAFDAIVVCASIRQGKHHPSVMDFVRRHLGALQSRPSAFFSVNLIARKPTRNTPATNPYLQRFVAASPWRPTLLGVFAGELDYARYGRFEKLCMQLVMKLNRGPTDPSTRVTFTDWQEVERSAQRIAALLALAGRPAAAAGPLAAAALAH